jgi:outer membrane receptor protein involved in Fe transport
MLIAVAGCGVLATTPGFAQSGPATLSGTVTDSSGGVLQGVVVEATNDTTHAVVSAPSDANGAYSLTAPAGSYTVRMRQPGFADHQQLWRAIAGEVTKADISLELAPFSERASASALLGQLPRPSEVSLQSTALPTPVTVLDHAELARTNFDQDAGALFRRVPAIMSHNIDQGETGTSIKMRGFLSLTHGADVAVYIDGVPQNVPESAINHGMNDMSWLTPDMIDRVEVIKGPFSALYGDQNRSGAINIITRSSAPNTLGGTFGSFGSSRGDVVFSRQRGQAAGLVVADLYRIGGYRVNSNDKRGSLFAKGSMVKGTSRFALRAVYYRANWQAAGFLNLSSVLAGTVKPTDADPLSPPLWGNGQRSSLVFTRTPAKGEAGLQLSTFFEHYQRTRAVGANPTDLNVQEDHRNILGARALENMAFGARASLAVGAELRRDRGDAINQRWLANLPSPNYSFNQDLNLLWYGAFAQGQVKPIASLKLLGGLRADTFDYTVNNRKLPAASVKYKQTATTPRAGIVWSPLKALDLFSNVGEGVRSPNQTEISPSGGLGPLGAPGGMGFSNLAPPKVKSYDVGTTASVTDRWRVSAARFHTLNQNEIVQVAPGAFDSVGNTTRDGWELESRVSATDTLGLYGSVGEITRARINNPLPNTAYLLSVPKHTIKGGAEYTAPVSAGRLLLNVDLFYISRVPYFSGTPLTLQYARPLTRYDVRGTYEVRKAEFTVFATFQPRRYTSEAFSAIAAGFFYDPRPTTQVGLVVRYHY